VTAPAVSDRKLGGSVTAVSSESISLRLSGQRISGQTEVLAIPRSTLAKLEVSRGGRSRGKNALVGLGIGAAVGVAAGLVQIPFTCPHNDDPHCDDDIPDLLYPVTNAVLGSAVGALIGAATGGERCSKLPTDRVRVGVAPLRGRGIAIRIVFVR